MADINRIFKALENPKTNWQWQLGLCKTLLVSPFEYARSIIHFD